MHKRFTWEDEPVLMGDGTNCLTEELRRQRDDEQNSTMPKYDVYTHCEMLNGEILKSVKYRLLKSDLSIFSPDLPNDHGMLAVELIFASVSIAMYSDWKSELRGTLNYCITVSSLQSDEVNPALSESDVATWVNVTSSMLWFSMINETITRAEVYGMRRIPQAICLVFEKSRIYIALGLASEPVLLGDGSDILIVTEAEWPSLKHTLDDQFIRLY